MASSSSTSGQLDDAETCPHCGGLGYVRSDVPLDHPDFGKLIPCVCKLAERAQRQVAHLRAVGNLESLSHMTFESFVPDRPGLPPERRQSLVRAYELSHRYAEQPTGWLLLIGGYGCGKTHLAAAIANTRVERGQPVLFITVPDLLDYLRATFSPSSPAGYDERFDEIRTAPLLVLDDLGAESATPWAQEKLFQILNYRHTARLPTVLTTNHELEEIPLRVRSRLLDHDLVTKANIMAPDYRSDLAADQSDLSSLHLHMGQTFETFSLRGGELPGEQGESLSRALETAREYAEDLQGWLTFTGPHGCGKTHLAAAIANHHAQQGYPVLFVLAPDLLDHLRATFSPQSVISFDKRFEEVRQAPLLVLDDLGTEAATSWAREKLYQIVDYRYNARRATVITTAFAIEELEKLDPRLATRILDTSLCRRFAINAPAYRGPDRTRRRSRR
jgi:DNA replication protein DnaC